MSLTEEVHFDKEGHIERFPWFKKLFLSLVIILVASLSFGIGRLSVVGKREPIKIEYDASVISNYSNSPNYSKQTPNPNNQTATVINAVSAESVVVSKNGTKYHFSHCAGAKQIKEENKITFKSSKAAEAAGYTLAGNCSPR